MWSKKIIVFGLLLVLLALGLTACQASEPCPECLEAEPCPELPAAEPCPECEVCPEPLVAEVPFEASMGCLRSCRRHRRGLPPLG